MRKEEMCFEINKIDKIKMIKPSVKMIGSKVATLTQSLVLHLFSP
jgi:hypothetical protein